MPKKTKEEKIRAIQHKQTRILQGFSILEPQFSPSSVHEKPLRSHTTVHELSSKSYFMSDFKKSIILILGIIALEIFFYFASMRSELISKLFIFK